MDAMTLADLQRRFLAAMRGSGQGAPLPVRDGRGIPSALGLAIYRNAYAARLREALDNDHPALGRYLGDAGWLGLCKGYIDQHPSQVKSLRWFGEALPAYLATTAPFSASPELAELATLERGFLDCFDAADAPVASWSTLAALPGDAWPDLRVRFQPALQCLRCEWNTVALWSALKDDEAPPAVAADPETWLLWRDQERVTRFRSLAADEAVLLTHFLDGGRFAGGCTALLDLHPPDAVPAIAIGLLRRWCDDALVVRWEA
jgi:hypothetical protein